MIFPKIFLDIFIFLFGLIIGSFLNVYILRLNTGKDTRGRSACASCGKSLAWYELIPILSFVYLKGRCKSCKTRISYQYPLVEFFNGLFYLLIFLWIPDKILAVLLFPLVSLSLAATVYDFKHKIIPQQIINLTLLNVALIVIYKFSFLYQDIQNLINLFKGIFIAELLYALPIFLLWFFSRGRAMGFGDVKLTASLAPLLVSAWVAWTALTLSFVLGAFFSLLYMAFYKLKFGQKISFKSEIAFGPFILVSFWIVFLSGLSFYDIINLL